MKINSILIALAASTFFAACDVRESIEDQPLGEVKEGYMGMNVPAGFDFATTREVGFTLSATGRDNAPIPFVQYEIYNGNPLKTGELLQTVRLDGNGNAVTQLELPTHIKELWIVSKYIGVEPMAVVPVTSPTITYAYHAERPSIMPDSFYEEGDNPVGRVETVNVATLGTWNSQGRPNYLTTPDKVTAQLIHHVNLSLPEQKDVRKHNPEILKDKYSRELYVNEDAEVWITYVHTGAGYRNIIGYYWYKDGEKPKTAADIKNRTVIFPNIQHGVLASGDKIKLTGPKNGAFEKGTHIGWFLIADGWRNGGLTNGRWTLYADPNLNSFIKDKAARDQMVFLYDASERILLMGWEDIRRDESGCDHDFNDVVFYASWNPITSVDLDDYAKIDTNIKDRDGDGVADEQDEYPDDKSRAFNNFSPAKTTFGTLLFEDLWPSYGDYDLNDLVVDYRVNEVADAQNRIKEINFTTVIRATGAGLRNGFGVELPVSADLVERATGFRHTAGYIKTVSTGLEAGQRNATVIVADDVNVNLPLMANVYKENNPSAPDTIKVKVVFKQAVRKADLGSAPYNPFMIVNRDRAREVHLVNKKPTSLMDPSVLASGDDNSSVSEDRYFVSKRGFNWALHIPQSIPYVHEKVDFTKGYPVFAEWVRSGGQQQSDWYLDIKDHRNHSNLFNR